MTPHQAMLPLPHPQHAQASSFRQSQVPLTHSAPQIVPAHLAAPPTPTMDDLTGGDHQTVSPLLPQPQQQPLQQQALFQQQQLQQQQQLFAQSAGFPYTPLGARPEITICITSCETPMPPRPHEQLESSMQAALMQQQQQQQQSFAPAPHSSLPFAKSSGPVFDSTSTGMTPQTAHLSLTASSSLQSSISGALAYAPPPPSYVAGFAAVPVAEALPVTNVTVAAGVMPRVQRPKRRHDEAAALVHAGHA